MSYGPVLCPVALSYWPWSMCPYLALPCLATSSFTKSVPRLAMSSAGLGVSCHTSSFRLLVYLCHVFRVIVERASVHVLPCLAVSCHVKSMGWAHWTSPNRPGPWGSAQWAQDRRDKVNPVSFLSYKSPCLSVPCHFIILCGPCLALPLSEDFETCGVMPCQGICSLIVSL